MSTQLRRIAQAPAHAPVRTKFFLAVTDTSGNGTAGDTAVDMAVGDNMSIMTASEFTSAAGSTTISTGNLLRDMGRQITVIDTDGNHLYKYRNVQRINATGAGAEGVPSNYNTAASNVYVLVWSADSSKVPVVIRTG
jgi:hypothetical protein